MTSLSACAHEIIASLSWAGGRRLATRCMVSGTVSAWIVVAVAWPEIAAWMVAIICSGFRHSPIMMSVGWRRIAPAMKSSKLFTLRGISLCEMVLVTLWTRSSRNSTGSAHSMMLRWASGSRSFSTVIAPIRVDLPDPVAPEDFRLDILLAERLRQIANRADDDIGARASARGDRRDVAAEAQRSFPRRADLVHDVDVAAALKPRHPVRAVEMVDDHARVVLVERIACRHLTVPPPESKGGWLEGREHHLFGAEPVGVGQERVEGRRRAARLLHPALAHIDPGIGVMRGLGFAGGAVEHAVPPHFGQRRAPRHTPASALRPG